MSSIQDNDEDGGARTIFFSVHSLLVLRHYASSKKGILSGKRCSRYYYIGRSTYIGHHSVMSKDVKIRYRQIAPIVTIVER